MNTTKFVAPNTVFDSSVAFLRNTTFDSSVYLQGVTHISNPATTSETNPYALVVETIGSDVEIKAIQLGTMATQDAAAWDASLNNIETSVGALDLLTQQHTTDIADVSSRVNTAETDITNIETSLGTLNGLINTNIANIDFLEASVAYLDLYTQDLSTRIGSIDDWQTYVDGSLVSVRSDINDVSLRVTDTEASILSLNGLIQTNIANIGFLETSIGSLDLLTQQHTTDIADVSARVYVNEQSITDLSTGKLDGVANINVEGDASVFAYELDNVAYLKKIVAGTDIVITEDVSTITISGAASNVSKYTDSFDPTGISQYSIPSASTGFTDGFVNVAVYENNQQVFPDIDVDANGNIVIVWAPGSLSPTVKVVAMG